MGKRRRIGGGQMSTSINRGGGRELGSDMQFDLTVYMEVSP